MGDTLGLLLIFAESIIGCCRNEQVSMIGADSFQHFLGIHPRSSYFTIRMLSAIFVRELNKRERERERERGNVKVWHVQ